MTRFDCIKDDNSGQMGSDLVAASVIYMCLVYHKYWMIALAAGAFDLIYYGP